jgi:alkylation response protein AidB-like acyl-CoA dehydrogenase
MLLTESQKRLRHSIREFAGEHIAPHAKKVDELAEFPWDNFHLLAEQGLFSLAIPVEYGGNGFEFLSSSIAVEEMAAVCASTSVLLCTQALASYSILLGGSEEQKKRFLTPLAQGKTAGAFCITEVDAGSDVSSVKTTAERTEKGYVLNGRKAFISNGGEAGIYVVLARTSDHRSRGLSLFIVEQGTQGLSFGNKEQMMGVRGSVTCDVILDNVEIPLENLVGNEGDGFKTIMNVFNRSRTLVGAQGTGIAKGAFDFAVNFLKERRQFGKPLSDFQMIQGTLANLGTLIEASRLLVREASHKIETQEDGVEMFASMAKCYGSDTAMKVTTEAVQLLGGRGYSTSYPVERMMRDAKVTQIYDGTNQIQRLIVARQLLS